MVFFKLRLGQVPTNPAWPLCLRSVVWGGNSYGCLGPKSTMETVRKNLVSEVRQRVAEVVVGQEKVVERLLIALFPGGHLLLQGVQAWPKRCWCRRSPTRSTCLQPGAVHHCPTAVRHPRIGGARPAQQRVHHAPWADLHQPAFGRRINRAAPKVQSACSRQCRSARSPSATRPTRCPRHSSLSPRKTRSSRAAHSSCRKHSSTGSCFATGSTTQPPARRKMCSGGASRLAYSGRMAARCRARRLTCWRKNRSPPAPTSSR
ncbi:MAG: hypothetical protein CM1200mP34_1080 [Verrucomicrobiales bacterium]|nr:MAG: hypothetical protein CM1200mP34_1080 [Verrucomicrobiales bacterium]